MLKYLRKISFPIEILFLLFIIANTVKLTGIQWIITQGAYTKVYQIILKNFLFLYFFWRIAFVFKRKSFIAAAYIIQTLYLSIHAAYYLYSGQLLTLPQFIYSFFEGLRAIGSLSIIINNPRLYLPLIDLIPVIVLLRFYTKIRLRLLPLSIILVPLVGLMSLYVFYRMDYFTPDAIKFSSHIRRNCKYGTLYSQIYDLTINELEYIDKIEYGPPLEIPEKDHLSNIISIQVESLNADLIGLEYSGVEIMPFLNDAARNNIYFPYLLSQHKTGNSSDAEFSVFNSVEAISGFPAAQFSIYEYPNSFVKKLSGFSKLAFHGNEGGFYNRFVNLRKVGFDQFWELGNMKLNEVGWGAPDENVYDFMLKKMGEEKEPFYFHHITMSSHGPFTNVPLYYSHPILDKIENKNVRNYMLTFSYVDRALGDFITKVQKEYPGTYLFIYGDHTVGIDEPSFSTNGSMNWKDDHLFEYIPLIIISPSGINYMESSRIASFLDIAPSILFSSGRGSVINTMGEILFPDASGNLSLENDIIYHGKRYKREELFNEIDGLKNRSGNLVLE
ncbi:MAG: sulfatase-like hydrolase/transferase [Spirochaetales bacterium]|nr:sulfatase-like hydrolase/transferase [Spirochaetales bacterium]